MTYLNVRSLQDTRVEGVIATNVCRSQNKWLLGDHGGVRLSQEGFFVDCLMLEVSKMSAEKFIMVNVLTPEVDVKILLLKT